jgi:cytochrome P450
MISGGSTGSPEAVVALSISILIAGHETTVGLLTNPDLLAFLRADPARIPAAVEEFLRRTGPAEIAWRPGPQRALTALPVSIGGRG